MLSHKNTVRLCTWTGVCLSLLYPMSVAAQAVGVVGATNGFIAEWVVKLITALNLMTWILFGFLNYLLDPAFIFNLNSSGGGDFMEMLNQIWQLARDLVNVAFAIVLVVGAVYTIAKADKSIIEKYRRDFVLALILVNFSWFIPRVVLDVANVATSAIFGIPSLMTNGGQTCEYTSAANEEFCTALGTTPETYKCECALITNMKMFVDDYLALVAQHWKGPANELFCYKAEKLNGNSVAGFSAILNGLIVNHGRLRELGRVPRKLEGATNVSSLVTFIVREIIILVIHIGFFFPLLALVAAFFIRIPILWVTMAFMPFYALKFVVPDSITEGWPEKIKDNFLKAAFLPAKVAIPLSIGFIMINAGSRITGQSAGISIRLFDGISNMWELMWMCMSMGVLWAGVFDVLKQAPGPIKGVAASIQGMGQGLGSTVLGGTVGKIPTPMQDGNTRLGGMYEKKTGKGGGGAGGGSGGNGGLPPDATAVNSGKGAKSIAADPGAKLPELNKHLDALAKAIKDNNKAGKTAAIQAINKTAGGHAAVGSANPEKDVEELLKKIETEMTTAGTAAANAGAIGAIKKSVESVKQEAKTQKDAGNTNLFSSTGTGTGIVPLGPIPSGMPGAAPVAPGAQPLAPTVQMPSSTPAQSGGNVQMS